MSEVTRYHDGEQAQPGDLVTSRLTYSAKHPQTAPRFRVATVDTSTGYAVLEPLMAGHKRRASYCSELVLLDRQGGEAA